MNADQVMSVVARVGGQLFGSVLVCLARLLQQQQSRWIL